MPGRVIKPIETEGIIATQGQSLDTLRSSTRRLDKTMLRLLGGPSCIGIPDSDSFKPIEEMSFSCFDVAPSIASAFLVLLKYKLN